MLNLYFLLVFLLVISSLRYYKKDFNDEYMSYAQTNCIKALSCIFLMFHHVVLRITDLNYFYIPVKYFAFPFVALFFFYSGYGLMSGLLKDKKYLNDFLKTRLPKILIPYLLFLAIDAIYLIVINNFDFSIFIGDIIFAKKLNHLWYITVLISLYLLFYFVFSRFSIKKSIKYINIFIILYVFLFSILNISAFWYSSVIGFGFGLYYKYKEDEFKLKLKNEYLKKLIILICAFAILFVGRLIISLKVTDIELLHGIYRNLLSVMFIIIILMLSLKLKVYSKILSFLGNISYEIYLTHYFIILLFSKNLNSNSINILFIIILTILISFGINKISRIIYNFYKKKCLM